MRILFQIHPLLAALHHHKTAVVLLVAEITLTMAILCNLVFVVSGTVARSRTPSGVEESAIGVIQSIGVIGENNPGTAAGNLAVLRAVPGVEDAAFGGPPLWYAQRDPVFTSPERRHAQTQVYEFQGSQGYSRTLGLHVVAGENFNDTMIPVIANAKPDTEFPVLITRALATRLFPDSSALGHMLYDGGTNPMRVIGIIDHLRGEITARPDDDYSIVFEYTVGAQNLGGGFMVRTRDPALLPEVLRAAAAALQKANPGHVSSKVFTFEELRQKYFASDLATSRMLVAIMLILLVVTALGVSGLASFWVQQRRRQIGMRRALGATRADVLNYFQAENFLIVTSGVVLGAACAYGLNLLLMRHFELARLPGGYLVVGALALWVLGQLAVLGPALRAAAVPPVVATRNV